MNDVIDEINIHLNRAFYKPIGYCIYCGSNGDGKELSSEHIFPYFLGGNVELEASSCNSCAKITSYLDGHCANKLFGTIRTQLGLQTRRPKHRQTDFPVIFETDAGLITRHVPIQEQPYCMVLPHFPAPGMLNNSPPIDGIVPKTLSLWTNADFASRAEKMREPGDKSWTLKAEWNNDVFARWIAKITLAGAVAMLGYEAKRSFLSGIILGTDKRTGYFIGSEDSQEQGITYSEHPPVVGSDTHNLGFGYWTTGQHTVLVASLQLFHKHGNPITYYSVVGEAMESPVENYLRSPSK